ncbi:MAG: Bug family tripartite tricarboxylate transporter substrate binding protein, partial [Burkholderiales bacterium]
MNRLLSVIAFCCLAAVFGPAFSQSYPAKPVEVVVHSGPGGGPDVFARAVTDMIGREKLFPQPMVVANRAGGGGINALNYVKSKRGDPYVLLTVATGTVLTAASRPELDLGLNTYTPIALFAIDPQTIAVSADSKFRTFKDLIEAARREPNTLVAGIGGPTGNSRLLLYHLERELGARFRVVSFKGGTDAALAVLGGHVHMAPENMPELLPHVEAKKMRILAVAGEKRMTVLPEVPTLKELGMAVTVGTGRGFAMPAGVPAEAAATMEGVLRRVHDSALWKDYSRRTMLEDLYLSRS